MSTAQVRAIWTSMLTSPPSAKLRQSTRDQRALRRGARGFTMPTSSPVAPQTTCLLVAGASSTLGS
eukprot:15449432-Alexandrium_andersonii.AAC.1